MILFTTVLLLIPDLYATLLLFRDILGYNPSPTVVGPQDYLFEGAVLLVVFAFALVIVWLASLNQPYLEYIMVVIASVLVFMGGGVTGIMANKCIPGLPEHACDGSKFLVGIIMVSFVTGIGYLIPRVTRHHGNFLAIVFLAVSVWSSELWIFVSIEHEGIPPQWGTFQGLFLLIFTFAWVTILGAMPAPQPLPPPPPANRGRR